MRRARRPLPLVLLTLLLAMSAAPAGGAAILADLEEPAAAAIGERIWRNEAGGRVDRLVHWLPGEDHASLGIGHFIWYPEGRRGQYWESFPAMLAFLEAQGIGLPAWLTPATPNPWPNRSAFLAARNGPRLAELRTFLARTVPAQLAFMVDRLERALPRIVAAAPPAAGPGIAARIDRLLRDGDGRLRPEGVYALVDYVNFKGEGLDPQENYEGVGWGLLQVLELMPPGSDPEAAFADAAARVLTRRVALAPSARNETRWLSGWLRRVETYRTFALDPRGADVQAARGS